LELLALVLLDKVITAVMQVLAEAQAAVVLAQLVKIQMAH